MTEKFLMKDGLNQNAVNRIAKTLNSINHDFPIKQFSKECLKGLGPLELKERVHFIIKVLADYLPKDFNKTAVILLQIKSHWDYGMPGLRLFQH